MQAHRASDTSKGKTLGDKRSSRGESSLPGDLEAFRVLYICLNHLSVESILLEPLA